MMQLKTGRKYVHVYAVCSNGHMQTQYICGISVCDGAC